MHLSGKKETEQASIAYNNIFCVIIAQNNHVMMWHPNHTFVCALHRAQEDCLKQREEILVAAQR